MARTFTLTINLDGSSLDDCTDIREAVIDALTEPETDDFSYVRDPDTGKTVGEWSIQDSNPGCSCGMADFGAEGHDGDATVKKTVDNGQVFIVNDQEFSSSADALLASSQDGADIQHAVRINGVLFYTDDPDA